jgi:hypothetical protein
MSKCRVASYECLPPTKSGANWTCPFRWKESAAPDANPIDLTGYSAFLQIRTNDLRKTLLVDASTANGLLTVDGMAGTVFADIPGHLMNIIPGQHILDLRVVSSAGFVMASPTVILPTLDRVTEPTVPE